MDDLDILRNYGLFDAKTPRYTSYPPANRFEVDAGLKHQRDWLASTSVDRPVSVYIHIPFCKRLCWFCACRTQGTTTMRPIEAYLETVIAELKAVSEILSPARSMARLHLGGGTPTLLTADQMQRLLEPVFDTFTVADEFEFSAEIDPTEVSEEVLAELKNWGLSRASIGVQDFDLDVQAAIGRIQSFEQTAHISEMIRKMGVNSLNFDLLYGLPYQTRQKLNNTIDRVLQLSPDRIALYGYAHVPHVAKRQVMIDSTTLPCPQSRYYLAEHAFDRFTAHGYQKIGLDHFALPSDSLVKAAKSMQLRRNFQGYTDDICDTLIGFGASAISKFPQGYSQNAVSTAAYTHRVTSDGFAAHKGYKMTDYDHLISKMIEMLMCYFQIDIPTITKQFPGKSTDIHHLLNLLITQYPKALILSENKLSVRKGFECAVRIIAAALDARTINQTQHSLAV